MPSCFRPRSAACNKSVLSANRSLQGPCHGRSQGGRLCPLDLSLQKLVCLSPLQSLQQSPLFVPVEWRLECSNNACLCLGRATLKKGCKRFSLSEVLPVYREILCSLPITKTKTKWNASSMTLSSWVGSHLKHQKTFMLSYQC